MKTASALFLALLLSASGAVAQTAMPESHIDTVEVTGAKDVEKTVHDYVKSYAKPTPLMGKMARWSAGAPICPKAVGLAPEFNIFVSERIRTIAGMVGARVETMAPCAANMVVLFTPHPQALLDEIAKDRQFLLGYHNVSQTKALSTVSHPVQAWYATATRDDNGILRADDAQAFDRCLDDNNVALNPIGAYMACGGASRGTRILDGMHSEMSTVTVVVDSSKIVGLQLGAVADYIAMLALSQTGTFENCLPVASITNLMTPGCDAGFKSGEISQSDIAFLKALNTASPDLIGEVQMNSIARQMATALGGR